MATINNIRFDREEILARMRALSEQAVGKSLDESFKAGNTRDTASNPSLNTDVLSPSSNMSFLDHLKEGLESVNNLQKGADSMAVDLASGKSQNLHETMLASTQAELGFNLTVQIRNKILEAYQEVMRLPV